jgi:hypothetical protein
MRILIDECVDPRVKQLFNDHEAVTVHDQGWGAKLRIGILVVHVPKNQIGYYRAIQKELLAALPRVRPGEVLHVSVPPI